MDNSENLHEYWRSVAFKILRVWIEAGFESKKLLDWALTLGEEPFVDALEDHFGQKPSSRFLGRRIKALVKNYEAWESTEPTKVSATWEFLTKLIEARPLTLSENPYLEELSSTFNLTEAHREILQFLFLNQRHNALDSHLEILSHGERLLALELACPSVPRPHAQYLNRSGLLWSQGLVEIETHAGFRFPFGDSYFRLEQTVFSTLSGDFPGGFHRVFFRHSESFQPIPLEQFPCKNDDLQILKVLLSRSGPSLVFFHGEPGTGKSEFARALSLGVGKGTAIINFDSAHTPKAQLALLVMSSRFQNPEKQILIIDEADNILNTANYQGSTDGIDKGILNSFFDEFKGIAIFISNKISGIERSVLRRFHFTMPFKAFSPQARKQVWSNLAPSHPVFTTQQLDALASTYEANPAQIKNTLQISMDLKNTGLANEAVLSAARSLLESSQRLLRGTRPTPYQIGEGYSLEWLNTDTDPTHLLESLGLWKEDLLQGGRGLGILFNGPPGTGKTLYGRHLASSLGLPLTCKRGSDLVSPYVGETEVNIRAAFEDSEGGILMIDEADSFFLDRNKAQRSWERSQTNEILQALESFRGLFIATTNFQQVFDEASFRRFSHKVSFSPLKKEQRARFLQRSFLGTSWSQQELEMASELEGLTPGDVGSIQKRLKYAARVDSGLILEELRKDLKVRGIRPVKIGFGGS